ncbi:MAG: hypothetical protein CL942_08555 [Desulfovibrio sp.]|nr:hypothetical protein [Desulfovibrio sp.]|tara:strand:+ start:19302 stop:19880 length:579 start_codon:yes stop_codon:yes gene_type:complete
MTNTSATSGYLTPTSAPIQQEAFEDAIQAMVVGVTGLPGEMVRPRYQPKPPRRPGKDENWCAIGVSDTLGSHSSKTHDSEGDGQDVVITVESLEVLASFYGPGAKEMATRLRDGLVPDQNRAELRKAGISVSEIGKPTNAPEMVNGAWVPRVDLPLNMQWETRQTYGVLNILSASGELVTDTGLARDITPKP